MLWVLGGRVGVVEKGKAAVAPTTFEQVNHLFSTGIGLQGFLSLHPFPNLRNQATVVMRGWGALPQECAGMVLPGVPRGWGGFQTIHHPQGCSADTCVRAEAK